jgi:LysM repeat protein
MGGEKGVQTKTYYECVQVEKGESLWEIAEEYKMDGADTEQMVDEIMEVNGLKNTNIRAGESIIVPVTKAA